MSNGPIENRLLMRRRLIQELKQDTKKRDAGELKKRYTPCPHCGQEGCQEKHEPEVPEETGVETEEKELGADDLSALLSE